MASPLGRCTTLAALVASLVVSCGGRTELSAAAPEPTDAGAAGCDGDCSVAQKHVFVNSDTTLYDVSVPSGVVTTIGDTGLHLTDIALSPKDVLVGVSIEGLSKVTQSSGFTSVILQFDGYKVVGADFAPDGELFVSGGSFLLRVDQQTGAFAHVASAPSPFQLDGDLAFVGNRLLASASTAKGSDSLLEIDVASGTSTIIGSIGYSCVWGLAPVGTSLFGFTCEGRVLSIDPQTGAGTELSRVPSLTFWGAASR